MKHPRVKTGLSKRKPLQADRRRVAIVDDHPMTRAGIAQLIEKQSDLEVLFEAGSPAEAMGILPRQVPDLLLTDITMPGAGGIDLIKDALSMYPGLPIIVVSMHDEVIYAERALRAGAKGYVMKEAGGEKLLAAIRRVLSGQVYVSEAIAARILDSFSTGKPRGSHSPIEKLSDREFEVLQLIGQGKSTRDIAEKLRLSSKTVDVHRANIKEKLRLRDAPSLIHYAVRWVEGQRSGDPLP